jgi:hypothetical protein
MGWTCSLDGENRECIQNLVGKSLGKQPLGRPGKRLGDKLPEIPFLRNK